MPNIVEKLKNRDPKTLLVVGAAAFVVVVMVIALVVSIVKMVTSDPETEAVKTTISESIGRTDFDITNIAVRDGDWYLVLVESTNEADAGNLTYMILKREGVKLTTVLGPSSAFSADILVATGVPDSIIEHLVKPSSQQGIWAGFEELRSVYSDRFVRNTQTLIKQYAEANQVEMRWVNVVEGSTSERTENERQDSMTTTIEFKFTINNDPRELRILVVGTLYSTVGQVLDDNGAVLAEKVYEIYY